jgi:hypothetical protein
VFLVFEFWHGASFFIDQKLGLHFPARQDVYGYFGDERPLPQVHEVIDRANADLAALRAGQTSLQCAEPLFGYRHEAARYQIRAGPTDGDASFFNLNHPGCFLFPHHYGCAAWGRIPKSEQAAFERFTKGAGHPWPLPLWVRGLLALNGFAIVVTVGTTLATTLRSMARRR